ncbi:erg26, C-3 sterol dehydrogenase [Aspergillus hancockii]|nr:erg26, C-3 sterol dehydrogenase [Aspergillus hancockii]
MSNKRPTMELGSVLVVGGCGFVGWHIVNQLLNFPSETDPSAALPKPEGDSRFDYPQLSDRYPRCIAKVAVVDLRTTNNRLPGAEYYDGDITSVESMLGVFRKVKPDVVIHTATPNVLDGNKELLRKVNVDGTKMLLEVAGGARGDWGGKCKAFVYTSSSSVVHDTQSDLINVNEEWPYVRGERQLEYYSETKADAEELVLKYNRTSPSNMLTCAVRPAGIYGEKDTTFTFKILEHSSKASPAVLRMQLGENNNLFDFTYVGNIAYSHVLAAYRLIATKTRLDSKQSEPLDHERVDGEAFNITNDSPVYFWDMTRAAWALTGKVVEPHQVWELPETLLGTIGGVAEGVLGLFGKTPRLTRRMVRYSCMTRYYSCDKAKSRLGYTPIVPVDEGLARAVGYVVERERLEGSGASNDYDSSEHLASIKEGIPGNDASFDYVVVGGGNAGVPLAARLAEQSFSVALVEAGDFYEKKYPLAKVPGAVIIGTGTDPMSIRTPIDWGFLINTGPGANYRTIHYEKARCVGGSTGSNYMVYHRPTKGTMKRWAELVDDESYTFDSVFPFYTKTINFTAPNVELRPANATLGQAWFRIRIGPAAALKEQGIDVIVDLPGVGQNLWDQVFFGPTYQVALQTFNKLLTDIPYLIEQVMQYFTSQTGALTNHGFDFVAFEKLPGSLRSGFSERTEEDLAWFPEDWPEVEHIVAPLFIGDFGDPIAMQPKDGKQYGTDTEDLPVVHPNLLTTETDQQVAIAAFKRAREIFRSRDSEILDVIRDTAMAPWHAAGTCKMGTRLDPMAVLDSRARVLGVDGLRVVDASAFPFLPPGHPQSVVYMLAEKIAADIIGHRSDDS